MTEDLTLTGLGGTALAEGAKFLYAQAAEALRYRRERIDAESAPAPLETPKVVERSRRLSAPNRVALARRAPLLLRALRAEPAEHTAEPVLTASHVFKTGQIDKGAVATQIETEYARGRFNAEATIDTVKGEFAGIRIGKSR